MFFLRSVASAVEANVMSILDPFNGNYPNLATTTELTNLYTKLKAGGVSGVMVDMWWGYFEKTEKSYDFSGYVSYFNYLKNLGFKVIPVMSFHQCGGNVGDTDNIPLPSFVTSSSKTPFFKDMNGHVDKEYISFAYDNIAITSRTPLQMYQQAMQAAKTALSSFLSDGTITEIEIGVGPCGEARYPAYQASAGWSYPGCGLFQSYDAQFLSKLKSDATAAGHSDWGHNPTNTGDKNVQPGGSTYWTSDWSSDYGKWFNAWYAKQLNTHVDSVLKIARKVFPSTRLSAKLPVFTSRGLLAATALRLLQDLTISFSMTAIMI